MRKHDIVGLENNIAPHPVDLVMAQLIHSFSRLCAAVEIGNNRLLWFACFLQIESGVLGYCALVAVGHCVAYEYDAVLVHRSSYVQAM